MENLLNTLDRLDTDSLDIETLKALRISLDVALAAVCAALTDCRSSSESQNPR
jgi:hypothetical protein